MNETQDRLEERLTEASERLLRDFDKTPEAIDYSELSARLWLVEREVRIAALRQSQDIEAAAREWGEAQNLVETLDNRTSAWVEALRRRDRAHKALLAALAPKAEEAPRPLCGLCGGHHARLGRNETCPKAEGGSEPTTQRPAEPDEHEHYWVDAPDDETGWHCVTCGLTEYPGDPGIGTPTERADIPLETYWTDRTAALAEALHAVGCGTPGPADLLDRTAKDALLYLRDHGWTLEREER